VSTSLPLPDDLAAAHAMILAEREARIAAEKLAADGKEAVAARLVLTIEIERLKLEIARLRRERFGPSSERSARIEQLELSLEELAETAAEVDAAVEPEAETGPVAGFLRRRPARRPLPEHLPRQRLVYPVPASCPCCGGKLAKLGEDVTETLERIPASWFVIQHVREKFSCRSCEAIAQAPAPFHPIARGRAGAGLLAEVVFAKFGLHLPLHRQAERFAREGVPIEVSTLADWVGAVTGALRPLIEAIEAHVRDGERIHADDTPVPVLAKGKTRTGRLWTVVRDDRPFGGPDPPAAAYFYSPDRKWPPSASLPAILLRHPAGRRLLRLRAAVRAWSRWWRHPRGGVLVACTAQVLRSGRSQEGPDGDRGGQADRHPVRHRTRDQRAPPRAAHRDQGRALPPPHRRT